MTFRRRASVPVGAADIECFDDCLDTILGKAVAFSMATHQRLGADSVLRVLDDDVLAHICKKFVARDLQACIPKYHLGFFLSQYSHIETSEELKKSIASIAHGQEHLRARRLTQAEADVCRSGGEVSATDKPFESLCAVSWDIRNEWQARVAQMLGGDSAAAEDDSLRVFIELNVALPDRSMCSMNSESCVRGSVLVDSDSDDDNPSLFESHMFRTRYVAEQGRDVLVHILQILQQQGLSDEERIKAAVKWIAELIVLQTILFPVLDRKSKVGFAGTSPKTACLGKYSGTTYFAICHEFERQGFRSTTPLNAHAVVYEGGKLVSINFGFVPSRGGPHRRLECMCCWCCGIRKRMLNHSD